MRLWKSVLILCFFPLIPAIVKAQDTLSLQQAYLLALENNYSISLAESETRIAGIGNTAGKAGMLPKLDLSAARSLAINNSHQEYYDGRTRDRKDAKTNNQSAGIQLTWTLFDGMNMFIQKEKLGELEQLSNIQLRSVVENTIAQVAQAYFNIVVQQELSDVYHEALILSAERQKFAKARFEVGSGSELAYFQATVDMNTDSANYISQMAVTENARANLNLLLCRDLATPFFVNETIPLNTGLTYETLLEKAIHENPELLRSRSSENLAALSIKEIKSSQLPKLSMNSGYNFSKSASDVSVYTLNRNLGFTVGLTLNYTIFDGFTTKQDLNIARIREESAQKETEQLKLSIEAQLMQVFNDYKTNLRLVAFEEESVQFARHNFSIAQEKYRLGSITDIELRETQKKLMDAENRKLSSLFRCKSAEVELLRFSGQLSGETGVDPQ